jgi:hypothetical protein
MVNNIDLISTTINRLHVEKGIESKLKMENDMQEWVLKLIKHLFLE